MDGKFPEPRGWALKWEGTALFPAADFVSLDAAARQAAAGAQEADAQSTRWVLQWRQTSEAGMPCFRNGNGRNGLARPLGWALKWDGAALVEIADRDETASLWAVEREKEDAA